MMLNGRRSGFESRHANRGLWVVVLLAAIALGCATAPEMPAPRPRAVLLAPTRFDPRLAQRLEPGAGVVDALMRRLLWEQDIQVNVPAQEELRDSWVAAARSVAARQGASGELGVDTYDATVHALAGALRGRGERFDALLVPYLTIRLGVVTGHSVSWDGVTRRLPLDYKYRNNPILEVRRQAPCTSLRLIAFDEDGHRLFERVGGLEVASRMRIDEDSLRGTWSDRADLFQDSKALREGVEAALRPLLRN
jgi:hypothetical protein